MDGFKEPVSHVQTNDKEMPTLRKYQLDAIKLIREQFSKGNKKVLLKMATGSGKACILSHIAKASSARGKKVFFLVRGRILVSDFSARLFREEVEHGTLLAGHWNYRPHLPIQVASVDTCISRNLVPEADILLIDESDLATSKGYRELIAKYPKAFILAVTATPEVDGSLRHIADVMVSPITPQELTDQGYLSPLRYFAPSTPDLSGVKVSGSTKDYVNEQLESAMNQGKLTGNIVDHWIKIARERPTILFAVNIRHSKLLMNRFLLYGVPAEHVDALTGDEGRKEAFERLEKGVTRVLCTVGIATRGVDLPFVSCLILARPTTSRRLHVQMLGRGTRICDGKKDTIVLDHSGNCIRHGMLTDDVEVDLDGRKKESHIKLSKICSQCFVVYRGSHCPECGAVEKPVVIKEEIKESDDQLVEITETDPILRSAKALRLEAKYKGRKPSWAHYRLIDQFGYLIAKPYLPDWFIGYYESKDQSNG